MSVCCPYCNKCFDSVEELREHLKTCKKRREKG